MLLAGAAYLPLDPAHPAARTSELLALSGAAAVVSTGPLLSGGAPLGDDPEVVDLSEAPSGPLAAPARPDDATLAYVIFTSGSTGLPKGVAVSHGSLANLMRWHQRGLPARSAGPDDAAGQPGFRRVGLGHLAHPGRRRDAGGAARGGAHLAARPVAWLADERITVAFLPTPLAEAVLDETWPARTRAAAHCTPAARRCSAACRPACRSTLVNVYGPAECTVGVTTATVLPGRPGAATDRGSRSTACAATCSTALTPVPDGEPGEMCLAGACVARGYLGDPAATARSFVPDIRSRASGCTGPATRSAAGPTDPSSTSAGSTIRSRSAGSGSSRARWPRCCGSIRRSGSPSWPPSDPVPPTRA